MKYEYEKTMTGFRFVFRRRQGHDHVQDMSMTEKAVYDLLREKDCHFGSFTLHFQASNGISESVP